MKGTFEVRMMVEDPTVEDAPILSDWSIEIENHVQCDLCWMYMEHLTMLVEKNKRYGNSALEPVGVFNKEDPGKGILIRLDDKLKRIKESSEVRKNDIADLMGYLALFCVAEGWIDFTDQID
jgi:hypothetical protein